MSKSELDALTKEEAVSAVPEKKEEEVEEVDMSGLMSAWGDDEDFGASPAVAAPVIGKRKKETSEETEASAEAEQPVDTPMKKGKKSKKRKKKKVA